MSLDQLEGFVMVAHFQNVSRAAEALSISQPALTTRIQNLEATVGQRLLLRTQSGVRLTDAGKALLPHAERALAAISEGHRAVSDVAHGEAGHLTVAATYIVSTYILPPVLTAFTGEHPRVRLELRTAATSRQVVEMVERESVQLGLTRDLCPPEFESLPLLTEDLVIVCGARHRLARSGNVCAEDIAAELHVLFAQPSIAAARFFRDAGIVPEGLLTVDNVEAAKKLVQAGRGLVLMPRSAVREEIEDGLLTVLTPVAVPPAVTTICGITRRIQDGPPPLVSEFLRAIREHAVLMGVEPVP